VMQGGHGSDLPGHIATISIARRGNIWAHKGEEDVEKEIIDSKDEEDLCSRIIEKGQSDEKKTETRADPSYEADEKKNKSSDVLMIKFGGAASPATRRSVYFDQATSRVTIYSKTNARYTWDILDGQPALFCIEGSSDQRQVVWSSGSYHSSVGGVLSTFPGSLTVYPEVRPMLDAIVISLVGWQHLKPLQENW